MISVPVSASAAPGIPHEIFDTHNLPEDVRFEVWRESVLPLFEPQLGDTPPEGFFVRVDAFNLRRLFVSLAEFSGQGYVRRHDHRADNGADHLLLQIYLTGGYVGQNGHRPVRVCPGDISLLDLGYSLETSADSSSTISVVIPRDSMFSSARPGQLRVGSVIRGSSPLGRILGHHLTSVWRALHSATAEDEKPICQTLLGAVTGAFSDYRDSESAERMSDCAVLDAICAHIERNLSAEDLTPESLCRRFGCSHARLDRMFQPLGGVAAYVRQRRLKRCLYELSRQRPDGRTIVAIATRWGFQSPSHFCKLFREQFGIAPSEAIEIARDRRVVDGAPRRNLSSSLPAFYDWLCGL
jgi:AraC-like DNA-binding protein